MVQDRLRVDRRQAVVGGVACCLLATWPLGGALGEEEEGALPAKGDRLVFDDGPNEGKPATLDLITIEGGLYSAVPFDATTNKPKTESRFSKILLLRFKPDAIDPAYREYTVDGVIALSAICTHQGCTINAWMVDTQHLECFCHHSQFIPAEGGAVAHGPARKRLPVLPIAKNADGAIIVAGAFIAKPGPGPA